MKVITLMLNCIIIYGCSTENSNETSKENFVKIDTMKIVNLIKKQVYIINSDTSKYVKKVKNNYGASPEGAQIIYHKNGEELKKINAYYFYETGKIETEYYFLNDTLIFEKKQDFFYNSPIYTDETKIDSVNVNQYFFHNNELLIWLNNDEKKIDNNSKEFINENKKMKQDLKEIR